MELQLSCTNPSMCDSSSNTLFYVNQQQHNKIVNDIRVTNPEQYFFHEQEIQRMTAPSASQDQKMQTLADHGHYKYM